MLVSSSSVSPSLFLYIFFFLLSQRRLITFINTFIPKRLQLVRFATFKSLSERKRNLENKNKKEKFTEIARSSRNSNNYCKINDNLKCLPKLNQLLNFASYICVSFSFHRHCPHPFFYRHPHPPCTHTRTHTYTHTHASFPLKSSFILIRAHMGSPPFVEAPYARIALVRAY